MASLRPGDAGLDDRDSPVRGYAVALGSVVAAALLRLAADPILGTKFPFATLFFAVVVSAAYGGFGPALVASVLGGLTATWLLFEPRYSLEVANRDDLGGLALYLAVSLGIAWIGGALWRLRRRAQAQASEADLRGEELRVTLASIGDAVITTDLARPHHVAELGSGRPDGLRGRRGRGSPARPGLPGRRRADP